MGTFCVLESSTLISTNTIHGSQWSGGIYSISLSRNPQPWEVQFWATRQLGTEPEQAGHLTVQAELQGQTLGLAWLQSYGDQMAPKLKTLGRCGEPISADSSLFRAFMHSPH